MFMDHASLAVAPREELQRHVVSLQAQLQAFQDQRTSEVEKHNEKVEKIHLGISDTVSNLMRRICLAEARHQRNDDDVLSSVGSDLGLRQISSGSSCQVVESETEFDQATQKTNQLEAQATSLQQKLNDMEGKVKNMIPLREQKTKDLEAQVTSLRQKLNETEDQVKNMIPFKDYQVVQSELADVKEKNTALHATYAQFKADATAQIKELETLIDQTSAHVRGSSRTPEKYERPESDAPQGDSLAKCNNSQHDPETCARPKLDAVRQVQALDESLQMQLEENTKLRERILVLEAKESAIDRLQAEKAVHDEYVKDLHRRLADLESGTPSEKNDESVTPRALSTQSSVQVPASIHVSVTGLQQCSISSNGNIVPTSDPLKPKCSPSASFRTSRSPLRIPGTDFEKWRLACSASQEKKAESAPTVTKSLPGRFLGSGGADAMPSQPPKSASKNGNQIVFLPDQQKVDVKPTSVMKTPLTSLTGPAVAPSQDAQKNNRTPLTRAVSSGLRPTLIYPSSGSFCVPNGATLNSPRLARAEVAYQTASLARTGFWTPPPKRERDSLYPRAVSN